MNKGWECRCQLCRDAFRGVIIRPYRWVNFLRHREGSVIRVDKQDDAPFYVTSSSEELYFTSDLMDGHKKLRETWSEEVALTEHMKKCEVAVEGSGYDHFSPEVLTPGSVNR